jgi:tetratricopeptide (TPR) repeat protein
MTSDDQKSKIKQLARQIKQNPGDSFSKFALALEFRKQGEFKKARILFEDILSSDPDYVGVYYHLGKLYEALDQLKDAQKLYEDGIEIADQQKEMRTKSELQEAITQVELEMEERSS